MIISLARYEHPSKILEVDIVIVGKISMALVIDRRSLSKPFEFAAKQFVCFLNSELTKNNLCIYPRNMPITLFVNNNYNFFL